MNEGVERYHADLAPKDRALCDRLAAATQRGKTAAIQGDHKNLVKRKGRLERLT